LTSWLEASRVYLNRRIAAMIFLGFASGLPFGVLADPLTAWLTDAGVTKTSIGLFALVSLPFALKFLWAPLIDHVPLPLLTRGLGRRRGWVLLIQILLTAAIIGLGMTDPAADLWRTAFLSVIVAFLAASQDIALDAYRVEILAEDQLAAGSANWTFGWRIAQVGGAALGLIFADIFPWSAVFTGLALLMAVGIIAILVNPEPEYSGAAELEREAEKFLERSGHLPHGLAHAGAWIYGAIVAPFVEFVIARRGWLAILLLILLYKFGDAVLTVMKIPFFLEIGFSKTEIAGVTKFFGFGAIIFGGFLGGALLAKTGIMRGLLISGVLMGASNLIFIAQALAGDSLPMLTLTIAVENVTTGIGTVAFVAYLSSLCNVAYTATQFALLTSFMAFSRTLMSSGAGWLADRVDWISFFALTTVAAVPGILLLIWMMRRYGAEPVAVVR
jgi:PAT family beta-lactamase induction signal transducer AmpG